MRYRRVMFEQVVQSHSFAAHRDVFQITHCLLPVVV